MYSSKKLPWVLPMVFMLGLLLPVSLFAQDATISGTVRDVDTGNPLAGANIMLEGTTYGAATDSEGRYTLSVPARAVRGQEAVVIARFIGYRTSRASLTLTPGTHTLNFELASDVLRFDEVIVTGQARDARRREIGSTVAAISTQDIELAPITSMSQLLQARVPGLHVQTGGGNVGQGSRIISRGPVSLATGVQPVIYVDGVRIDNSRATGVWTGGMAWTGLDDINWNDVERVEVVRGAAASTLYGTQAAGGVIQIFTRSGFSPRPTEWTYSSQIGFRSMPKRYYERVSIWADWFHDNFARNGLYQQQQLSAQGNVGGYQYYTSFTYRTAEGTLPDNDEEYYSVRGNLQFLPREDMVVRLNTGLTQREVSAPQEGNNIFGYLINGLVGGPDGFITRTELIPEYDVKWRSRRAQVALATDYTPLENLTVRMTTGLEFFTTDNTELVPYGVFPQYPMGQKYVYRRNVLGLNLDLSGTYSTVVVPNVASTTTLGFQATRDDYGIIQAWGQDFPAPGVSTLSAATITNSWEGRSESVSSGFFGQQRFGFYDLIYVGFGFRLDRHSAFGVDYGDQFYPAFDISYVVSEHDFFPRHLGELRLRFAYGESGNPPSSFAAMRLWSPIAALDGEPAVTTSNLGDLELGPERSTEWEFGLDLSVLRGRVNLEATYYNQETLDAIFPVTYPPSAGWLAAQQHNVAGVKNTGVELSLNIGAVETRNVRWNLIYNFSYNENEITKIDAEQTELVVQWSQSNRVGYPVAAYFGQRFLLDEENQPYLVDGYIGPSFPVRSMQITSDLTLFRNFNLRLLFDHAGGHYTQSRTMEFNTSLGAHPKLFRFDEDGNIVPIPPQEVLENDPWWYYYAGYGGPAYMRLMANSVVRADYWRLRELTATYRVPDRFARSLGVRNMQIYFSGRNLWSWIKSSEFIMDGEINYQQATGFAGEYATQDFYIQPNPMQFIWGLRFGF